MIKASSFNCDKFINDLFIYYYPQYYEDKITATDLFKSISPYVTNIEFSNFSLSLTELKKISDIDLKFYFEKDPAMTSYEEIVISNLAFRCIEVYRFSNYISQYNCLISSLLSKTAKRYSGIDIAYKAKIGYPFFIDHGVGTVIGETSIVGKRVSLYQCVTLGARSLKEGRKLVNIKRHPTLEDDVTMYSYSSVFGDITIKKGTTIKAYECIYK